MAAKKSTAKVKRKTPGIKKAGAKSGSDVDAFLSKLSPPMKKCIEAIRRIILGVSPKIGEGIKWNSPSFRTTEYFATVNMRGKGGEERVWLILHLGAKVKDNSTRMRIADPAGMLKWLAQDRCLVTFTNEKDIKARSAALKAIVREWIKYV